MKIKIPKTIIIGHRDFSVIIDKKDSGASFSYKKMTIKIGTANNTPREIFEHFMHEVMEIICVEKGIRSSKCLTEASDLDYVFTASHREFCLLTTELSRIMADLICLKDIK